MGSEMCIRDSNNVVYAVNPPFKISGKFFELRKTSSAGFSDFQDEFYLSVLLEQKINIATIHRPEITFVNLSADIAQIDFSGWVRSDIIRR